MITKKAFTLLELLVVLFLLSLALSLIGPKIATFKPLSSHDFSTQIFTLIKKGQRMAFLKNNYFLIIIDPKARKFSLVDKKLRFLEEVFIPEEIEIKGEGLFSLGEKKAILFLPGGFSSGGEIEILTPKEDIILRIARLQVYCQRRSSASP